MLRRGLYKKEWLQGTRQKCCNTTTTSPSVQKGVRASGSRIDTLQKFEMLELLWSSNIFVRHLVGHTVGEALSISIFSPRWCPPGSSGDRKEAKRPAAIDSSAYSDDQGNFNTLEHILSMHYNVNVKQYSSMILHDRCMLRLLCWLCTRPSQILVRAEKLILASYSVMQFAL